MAKKSKQLVNEFSWSFSRRSVFGECQKRYWYNYYGSWEGWPRTPYDTRLRIDPLASHLYMLKQIQSVAMFVGSCVHTAIEETLKKHQFPELEFLQHHAIELFRAGIQESLSGAWKESPKKYSNLFEHYFGLPIGEEVIQKGEEKIRECIKNWVESPIPKMAFDPRAKWVSIEELTHFMLGDRYKILVVIDFAMKWVGKEKETLVLFYWKTGGVTDKTDEQLLSYALFANRALNVPLENIILSPFYLFHNEYKKIMDVKREDVERVEKEIIESCDAMAEKIPKLVPEPGTPPPDPRLFPYTTNRNLCLHCPFQRVCQGAQYQDLSREELALYVQ